MPGPHNEPPSMAGASGARFLSPVMSISSRTINLGNNGDSQHLESHYVHENSLTEQEKSGIKNLFNLASEKKIEFCQLEFTNPLIVNVSCKQTEKKTLYQNRSQMLKGKDPSIQNENETFAVVIRSIESIFNFFEF